MLCFLARNTLGGSGLGIFAGAWLASGVVLLSSARCFGRRPRG
jgi:hypothetical protein